MNLNRHMSMPQIIWILGTMVGLGLAVLMGSAIGTQDFRLVTIVLGAGVGIATFLLLGKNYWVLIPFSLGASFPAIPIGGRSLDFPELAIIGCTIFFALRLASRKEKLRILRSVNIPILLFVAWVGMVFVLNPVGLAMLGSQTGGARFYFKLGLAFSAFLVMSCREYTEKDIKWIFALLIFGACFSLVYGFAQYAITGPSVDPTTGMVMEEFYTWHQLLAGPPVTLVFLVFSRWSPREVFSLERVGLTVFYFLCLGLVLLSGKRMALASVILAPLVSAIMYRQFIYILVGVLIAATLLFAAVAGQGQLFKLPLVAQRTLSWLPGDWDPELQSMAGGTDDWRAELRRYAMANIQRDPWIGRGFSVDINETVAAVTQSKYVSGIDIQTAAYALGRSWHNRWLGYAADFGIPLSLIQLIVYIWVILLSAKVFYRYRNESLFGIFSLYLLIYTSSDCMASYTSGHTSLDAFARWWMYGILVAIYTQTQVAKRQDAPRSTTGPDQRVAVSSSHSVASLNASNSSTANL